MNQLIDGPVLLATRDESVLHMVGATASALGVPLHTTEARDEIRAAWPHARLRLVGPDVIGRVLSLPDVAHTWLVGNRSAELLRASAELGVPALTLPDASERLAAILREDPRQLGGTVTVVMGASGGVGTSTIAAGLAAQAAQGATSIVVEMAEGGGGLDLLLGAETQSCTTWDDLANATGAIGSIGGLLHVDGVHALPLGRAKSAFPDQAAISAVLRTLRRSFQHVVIDGGRGEGLAVADATHVWVVPADVRGVAAARMVLSKTQPGVVRLVVRTGPGRTLPPQAVAEALGLDMVGIVRHQASVARFAGEGVSMTAPVLRGFRKDMARLWEVLA